MRCQCTTKRMFMILMRVYIVFFFQFSTADKALCTAHTRSPTNREGQPIILSIYNPEDA